MTHYLYKVVLEGYTTQVRAFNSTEAVILAQAEAIKEGKLYSLVKVNIIG